MQVYEKTDRADPYIDYFPTGRRFFAPETRAHLMRLAIEEAGLGDKVEIAFWPEIYDRHGFHGVLREVRRRYPGRPLHGLHGSDTGGMMVRAIMDECGWIYPMAILRRDNVSATAIRGGAQGMTPASITTALAQLQSGTTNIVVNERKFRNEQGVLLPA